MIAGFLIETRINRVPNERRLSIDVNWMLTTCIASKLRACRRSSLYSVVALKRPLSELEKHLSFRGSNVIRRCLYDELGRSTDRNFFDVVGCQERITLSLFEVLSTANVRFRDLHVSTPLRIETLLLHGRPATMTRIFISSLA